MGVERSITRWYVRKQLILEEIQLLETQLAQRTTSIIESVPSETTPPESDEQIQLRLTELRERLRTYGPCPKPMMG